MRAMTAGQDDGAAWEHLKRPGAARTGTRHRDELAQRFAAVTELRPELGRHVGAGGRDLPVYRWVPYKEAYSPALVHAVLNHLGLTNGTLYDPFCGSGTSLLVAAERGLSAVGVERLPYAAYAAQTSLAAHRADRARLLDTANAVLTYRGRPRPPSLDVPAAAWAFSPEVSGALARLTCGLMRIEPGVEAELLRLALLTTVESASYAVKDGTIVRQVAVQVGEGSNAPKPTCKPCSSIGCTASPTTSPTRRMGATAGSCSVMPAPSTPRVPLTSQCSPRPIPTGTTTPPSTSSNLASAPSVTTARSYGHCAATCSAPTLNPPGRPSVAPLSQRSTSSWPRCTRVAGRATPQGEYCGWWPATSKTWLVCS